MVRARVDMNQLTFSEEVVPRMVRSGDLVDEYAEIIRLGLPDGTQMGLAVVFHDGQTFWVADGVKRLGAQEKIGVTQPFVDLKKGSKADAIWWAAGANLEHGTRLSNKEKVQAVINMLSNDIIADTFTNQMMADKVGVSVSLIKSTKARLAAGKGKRPRRPSPPAADKRTGRPSQEVAHAKAKAEEEGLGGRDLYDASQKGQIEHLLNSLQRWVKKVVAASCLAESELEAFRTALDDIRIPFKQALDRLGG